MPHLEGVLTLVSGSGPWFRLQGRHVRPHDARPLGVRLMLDPRSGVTVDLHGGSAVWLRAGWYPPHPMCKADPNTDRSAHRCWGRWLQHKVLAFGVA